ncbi:Six-hairpin glycosidase-like protein [Xylogone sp. PMI_703]|nr:Six-hairpin glycosidase-like protein [Xylogone sp. PMI_703]
MLSRSIQTLALSNALLLLGHVGAAPPNSASNPNRLWDISPASSYADNYPIGNGRVGAMVGGSASSEAIQVNEDSYWSGGLLHRVNPSGYQTVKQMQSLLKGGSLAEATRIAGYGYQGTPVSTQHYENMGYLTLTMDDTNGTTSYERWLDLEEGAAGMYYVSNDVEYTREYIASNPDEVIAIHITASKPGSVSFTIHLDRGSSLNRWLAYSTSFDNNTIVAGGSADGVTGIDWAAGARVTSSGGSIYTVGDYVFCSGADEATIYFTAWTSVRQSNPHNAVLSGLAKASSKSFDLVRAVHISDYQKYMSRVSLNLGNSTSAQKAMTTTQRMATFSTAAFDPELAALYFQFGRYTLISTSRQGTLPPNLQGIWSQDMDPMWGSKYTININLEMNYWPSLTTNLADLTTPLNDLLNEIGKQGSVVARQMYHASGIVAHHNTDLWGDSAPQDNYLSSTCWPMGASWLITHLMEHYRFTGDKTTLKANYNLFQNAVLFALDFLTPYEGYMVTNPSISPENLYYVPGSTQQLAITYGPTIDNSLLWELLGEFIDIHRELNLNDKSLADKVTALRALLPPLRMNQYGGIAEWIHDYNETDPGHRHWSMLWGLYPGSQITTSNQDTFNWAISSIQRRLDHGSGSTAWSRAWSIALSARAYLPDLVHSNLAQQLANYTTHTSLLATGPPADFQIDGTFGGPAGMVEAFLQSHETVVTDKNGKLLAAQTGDANKVHLIRLLPAVPSAWGANGGGSVSGLVARGAFEVDIIWSSDGKLSGATITSNVGNQAYVTLGSSPIGATNATEIMVKGAGSGGFVLLPAKRGTKFTVKLA